MAIAYFPSLEECDTIEVVFLKPLGGQRTLRLLVDSGFTGQSCFVLAENADDLGHASAPASQATGALQGKQKRVVVMCRIEELLFQTAAVAILSDISNLALGAGTQGMVGLQFLRLFQRWGGERTWDGAWRFFLETNST
jgi:hypothetical protein